ncbi:MAG: hypothetical protein H6661_02520 [Ardenticatenaceae bacterium]|nr:hypothetical protein [Ardenticatenaceae bacterium]
MRIPASATSRSSARHAARWKNIVAAPWTNEGQPGDVISISFAEPRLEDENGDGRLDFLVHGGTIGSVGAGIMRPYTEVWRWDGTAVTLAHTQLDPTTYRHHYLLRSQRPDGRRRSGSRRVPIRRGD